MVAKKGVMHGGCAVVITTKLPNEGKRTGHGVPHTLKQDDWLVEKAVFGKNMASLSNKRNSASKTKAVIVQTPDAVELNTETGVGTQIINHVTGRLRGELCHGCNCALGLLDDDIDRIIGLVDYLKSYGAS